MTRAERENALHCLKVMIDEEVCEECNLYGTTGTDHCEKDCVRVAIKALEQEPILDKIREQMKDYLRGVEITLEVLVENDPLRPKMEGAKDTLEECLELIDKAETEGEACITTKL